MIEARRAAPAILFLPHLQLWWETAPASLKATLTMLLADLPQDLPLLLLATADSPADELEAEALKLFSSGGKVTMFEQVGNHGQYFHDLTAKCCVCVQHMMMSWTLMS